jgi:phosphinothricin acetyltransferase
MIRDAGVDDMAAVAAIYAREVLEGTATFEEIPPSTETLIERLAGVQRLGLPWLVAEIDGQVAAYAYASPFRLRSAYRYTVESSVYVGEAFQGRGLGQALMTEVVARCRALGLHQMIAAISSDLNPGSIALHERLGFLPAGVYRRVGWKFGRWIDVAFFQLELLPDAGPPAAPGLDLG